MCVGGDYIMQIYAVNSVIPTKNVQKAKKVNSNPSFGSVYSKNIEKGLSAKIEHSYYAKELFAKLLSAVRGDVGFAVNKNNCIDNYKFISDLYLTLLKANKNKEKIVLSKDRATAKPIITSEAGKITFHDPGSGKPAIQFAMEEKSCYVLKRPNNLSKFYLCGGKKETYDITPEGKMVNHKFFKENGDEYIPTK